MRFKYTVNLFLRQPSRTFYQRHVNQQRKTPAHCVNSHIDGRCGPPGHKRLMKLITRRIEHQYHERRNCPSPNAVFFGAAPKRAEQQPTQNEILREMTAFANQSMNDVDRMKRRPRQKKAEDRFNEPRCVLGCEFTGGHGEDKRHPEDNRKPVFHCSRKFHSFSPAPTGLSCKDQ
jgi:hypothetical protein